MFHSTCDSCPSLETISGVSAILGQRRSRRDFAEWVQSSIVSQKRKCACKTVDYKRRETSFRSGICETNRLDNVTLRSVFWKFRLIPILLQSCEKLHLRLRVKSEPLDAYVKDWRMWLWFLSLGNPSPPSFCCKCWEHTASIHMSCRPSGLLERTLLPLPSTLLFLFWTVLSFSPSCLS